MSSAIDSFGPYVLHDRIGDGGFADVFIAARADGRRKTGAPDLVIKRLHKHLCDQPDMVDMFVTEARVLAELDHPSIVRMFELERVEDGWAMVMERVDGVDAGQIFDHAMTIGKALPQTGAVQLVLDVAEALHHAHERQEHVDGEPMGIIHRDVKPDNLLITWDGRVKLIDFGCAKATLQSHLTRPGIRKGTLDYMSPEQCLGRTVDRRTDVFSLGVVLYELLTMTRLYADASDARVMERIVHEVARPPSWLDDRVSPSLDLVVLRALEKRPEERFGTAAEMARALRWWLDRYAPGTDGHAELADWMRAYAPGRHAANLDFRTAEEPSKGGNLVLRRPSPQELRGISRRSAVGRADEAGPGRGDVVPEARFVALQSLIGRRSNLSPETAPMIGRAALIRDIEQRFTAGAQVVALVGAPGIGKSRLAEAVLRGALLGKRQFGGGVWWCSVDDVVSHGHLATRVAGALGIDCPDNPSEAVATVARSLASRGPTRLCIDGADRFDEAAWAVVGAFVRTAPELEIVATAQDGVGEIDASVVTVPPMELPSRASVLVGSEAADLFVQEARERNPDFGISADLRTPLHALLKALGAVPGAIRVAAAQVATGDPLAEVHQLLARHQGTMRKPALDQDTLGAAMHWAWEQLSDDERGMLAALSLFHGGFDLPAAVAVGQALDPPVRDGRATLELLRQRTLLTRYEPPERPGSERLKIVRTARAFARARLLDRQDVELARRAHAQHYLAVGRRLAAGIEGPQGPELLRELRVEMPNITSVIHRALRVTPPSARSANRALGAALALWGFTDITARYGDFAELASGVLAHAAEAQNLDAAAENDRIRLCVALARSTLRRGDSELAAAGKALEWARSAMGVGADDLSLAAMTCASGEWLLARGEAREAESFFLEASRGEPSLETVHAWLGLAECHRAGHRLEKAEQALGEAIAVAGRSDLLHGEAVARLQAGRLAVDVEQYDAADAELRTAQTAFERFGDEVRAGLCQLERARSADAKGDPRAARRLARDAAARLQRVGRDDLVRPYAALIGTGAMR